MKEVKYTVGIDEAGRGPLAGPVAVGLVCIPKDFDWRVLTGVTDSKKLTESKRETIYKEALRLRREGRIDWRVVMPGATEIDRKGISKVIKAAIATGLKRLCCLPERVEIRLDGLLYAPPQFQNQKTIIKGDQKEKVIGLASILAKVTRDRHMVRLAARKDMTPYDFATHKGYGTKDHRKAIKEYGLSIIHRSTYCTRLK